MASNDQTLKHAARRAYELGRICSACQVLLVVIPAAIAAAVLTSEAIHAAIAGTILAIAAVGMMYRGEVYARAVGPGLLAGLASAAAAICMCHAGVCGPGEGPVLCVAICLFGGAISGVIIVRRSLRFDSRRRTFLVSAAGIAFLTGSLGCAMLGVFGVAGLAAGVAIGAVPLGLVLARSS